MTEKRDFDMYSNFKDNVPMGKKRGRANNVEFGEENYFEKNNINNKDTLGDWVDRIIDKHYR